MTSERSSGTGRPWLLTLLGLLAVLALGGGIGWFARSARLAGDPGAALAPGDRSAIEAVVRSYILDHPEVLPEAMDRLRQSDSRDRLAAIRGAVTTPFPGAVLGNPHGKLTLVEFSDYACGYCRRSVADVEALVAGNPELRVVMRELPILSPQSADAARWALAAAEQGKYAAFHRALFAAGRPSPASIEAAARTAGLDLARAKATATGPNVDAELKRNLDFARQLGFEGTPSWIAGNDVLAGSGRQGSARRGDRGNAKLAMIAAARLRPAGVFG